MNILKFFTRNYQDDSEGQQVEDHLYQGEQLRIIVSFDSYYSSYGEEHIDESNIIRGHLEDDDSRVDIKYLFRIPIWIPYRMNNGSKIAIWMRPAVYWILNPKRKIKIHKDILENIIKYCEDKSIYDKLSQYDDFYYKIKRLFKA